MSSHDKYCKERTSGASQQSVPHVVVARCIGEETLERPKSANCYNCVVSLLVAVEDDDDVEVVVVVIIIIIVILLLLELLSL